MRYETIEHLKDTDFKRLTGVQRETFDKMLKVVEKGLRNFGRPTKLSRADQLLMTLMYWREYRTEFHIPNLTALARQLSVGRSGKLKTPWCVLVSFGYQARRHFKPVTPYLKSCWWMSANSRLSVQKKPKTALQRQKEASYPKSTSDCRSKKRSNCCHGF